MKNIILAASMLALTASAAPAMAQSREAQREYREDMRDNDREYREDMRDADSRRDVREARSDYRRDARRDWRKYRNYDYNRMEPGMSRYDASRYYRSGNYYQTRRLSVNDRIYRGNDDRYYCRRSDGTTGLIVGGLAGGLVGNTIGRGDNNTLGAILGAAGGALAGRAIERGGNVRCR
jgi:hypothetical protein